MPTASYHHGGLREALLAAAERDLDAGRAPTLRDLARTLGVSPNAPYRHFATRAELYDALAERGFRLLACDLRGRSLADVYGAYFAFALARPELFRLMFAGASPGSHRPGPEATRLFSEFCRCVGERLPSETAPDRIVSAAWTAWAAIHGFAALWIEEGVRELRPRRADGVALLARAISDALA